MENPKPTQTPPGGAPVKTDARADPPPLPPSEALKLVKHCVDYRTLLGKRDELSLPLSDDERERLESLTAFFRERGLPAPARNAVLPVEAPAFARRDHHRRPLRIRVEYAPRAGTPAAGRLRNLSGGGAFVETAEPLPAGQRTILRITDPVGAREWRIGAEVAWNEPGQGMGLRFLGVPLEVRLGRPVTSRLKHAA